MDMNEAIEIVMDLARQNALDCDFTPDDDTIECPFCGGESERQSEALDKVEEFFKAARVAGLLEGE